MTNPALLDDGDDYDDVLETVSVGRADFYQMMSYRTGIIEGVLTKGKQKFEYSGTMDTRLILFIPEQSDQAMRAPSL